MLHCQIMPSVAKISSPLNNSFVPPMCRLQPEPPTRLEESVPKKRQGEHRAAQPARTEVRPHDVLDDPRSPCLVEKCSHGINQPRILFLPQPREVPHNAVRLTRWARMDCIVFVAVLPHVLQGVGQDEL